MNKKTIFFTKIFLSLSLILLFFFFLTRKNFYDHSYNNYLGKILYNFGQNVQQNYLVKQVTNWFNPTINESTQDSFINYKLVIVLKYLDNFFQDLLKDTQKNILDENIHNLKKTVISTKYYENFKKNLKDYLTSNKDLLEVSLYEESGEKLIGIKYKNIGNYTITPSLIKELEKKNNLLLKHQNNANLILLSLVKDKKKPFLIISQTINHNFFPRILDELEVSDNLFYFKDSRNFVVLDNYNSHAYKEEKNNSSAYKFYQAFTEAKDVNLAVNINKVDFSLGVVVDKNNFLGNALALLILVAFFALSFIFFDWLIQEVLFRNKQKKTALNNSPVPSSNYSTVFSENNASENLPSQVADNPNASNRLEKRTKERNRSIFLDLEDG